LFQGHFSVYLTTILLLAPDQHNHDFAQVQPFAHGIQWLRRLDHLFIYSFFYNFFIVVLGGGPLWHLQKFLLCTHLFKWKNDTYYTSAGMEGQ
jgi:hypothetical protein